MKTKPVQPAPPRAREMPRDEKPLPKKAKAPKWSGHSRNRRSYTGA